MALVPDALPERPRQDLLRIVIIPLAVTEQPERKNDNVNVKGTCNSNIE